MTKQVLKTVYELDEVKEKAIKENRYINIDSELWFDDIVFDWKNKLDEMGFCNAEIYFSGFGSQGDGACFDNDSYHFDLDLLLKNVDLTEEEKEKIYNLKNDFDLFIKRSNSCGSYCHEKTRYIEIDDFYIEDEEEKFLLNKFENLLEDLRFDLCNKIFDDLEEEYYYLTSDNAVYETLQANEYYFEENGKIARI